MYKGSFTKAVLIRRGCLYKFQKITFKASIGESRKSQTSLMNGPANYEIFVLRTASGALM